MLFHRVDFLIFFVVVWGSYVCLGRRAQNVLLLGASLFFYGSWNWKFLGLIAISAVVDYAAALAIERWPARKRIPLVASIVANLGILFTFKYFNFFAESVAALLSGIGMEPDFPTLHVILPVGLSFYTFQTMSYTIDVYRGRQKARRDFLTVGLFVCYFPQLVAGPVERARRLMPQFERARSLDWSMITNGFWFIALGLFKKIAIADLLVPQIDPLFANLGAASLAGVAVATFAFGVQLYADFSGYSDMAIGLSLLLGIRLSRNFRQPLFFARSFTDFWQRWHITMTGWFRDYVYGPLRGASSAGARATLALVVMFTLVGLWHGADWTFVIWGGAQGLLLLLDRAVIFRLPQARTDRWPGPLRLALAFLRGMSVSLLLTAVLFLFRLESLSDLPDELAGLSSWEDLPSSWKELFPWLNALVLFLGIDAVSERKRAQALPEHYPMVARFLLYLYFALAVLSAGGFTDDPYVYFQF